MSSSRSANVMSYRSIKNVLGETSLERKCRILFGVCLLVLITASFLIYGSRMERIVRDQNRNTCRLLVIQSQVALHAEKLETDERYSQMVREMVRELTASLSKEEYRYAFIALDRTGRPIVKLGSPQEEAPESETDDEMKEELDPGEEKILARFVNSDLQGISDSEVPPFEERFTQGQKEYQYYQPIHADAPVCVTCHGALASTSLSSMQGGMSLAGSGVSASAPLIEGDLMAIARVTISNERTQRALNKNRAILLTLAIVTVFLAMVASYVIVRYVIVKPLRHLRDVSDAISHGDIALRADIRTGDEFESLAVSFNRMLRNLVSTQDELRHVNTDLDGKVDELAQVNMRLYEMNTIKSDFLATMSHELRTPLNSILGFSEVLESIESLDEKQLRYVQNIQSSGRVLLDMINDILDLAKMESGKMDVRLTDFQIEQVVRAQCDMARPLTEKKNIDLKAHIDPGLPPLHQDQARVQQVINNLLSNAIKFTPEGGRITVSASRDAENRLRLQIIDTGVGIAEEDQRAIFEKFRQGGTAVPDGDAMTREYSGTGLGLSIVKELCKLLGGEITTESELGKGSTFTVRLPWQLQEQPRLDSELTEGFEQFARSRHETPGKVASAAEETLAGEPDS